MKNSILILSIFVLTQHVNGQSNFVPGTVVITNGDSITGKIDYRDWKKMPEKITFENNSGQKQNFDAASIKSFIIIPQKEVYISHLVEIDMTPDDADKVLADNITNPLVIEKNIFMLQLVKHPVLSLYEFADNNDKLHFYYVKQNEKPVELIHHYIYSEQYLRTEHNTKFKEQLAELFSACPAVAEKTENLKYREKEIQEIIVKYLNCINPTTTLEVKKKTKLPVKFGVLGGVMFNNYKFIGEILLAQNSYSPNTSPVFGISADVGLSRGYDKLHIIGELIYKNYKTGSAYSGSLPSGGTYQSLINFDFSYIQVNTMLGYFFDVSPNVKPFLNAGIGNAFVISEKENKLYTKYSFGREETSKGIYEPRMWEFSYFFGAGIGIKKIKLELRYGSSQKAFSSYNNLNIATSSPQIIITYQF